MQTQNTADPVRLPLSLSRSLGDYLLLGVVSLIVTVVALTWAGFDFSRLSTAFIGTRQDTLLEAYLLYQMFDNITQGHDLGNARLFYGEQHPMTYQSASYGLALLLLPLYVLTGSNLILTYNLYIVSTFVLTTLTAYGLVDYLLPRQRWAAAVAALLIAFTPYRYFHLEHPAMLAFPLLLLGVYCIHRLLDTRGVGWAVSLGGVSFFLLFTAGYLWIMLIIAALILSGAAYFWDKLNTSIILLFAGAVLITALAGLPFLSVRTANSSFFRGFVLEETLTYSPSPLNWFISRAQVYYGVNTSADPLLIGYTLAGLALWAWLRRRAAASEPHTRLFSERQILIIYAVMTVTGYLLSLGPALKWGDDSLFPLPTMLLYRLPAFNLVRAPSRMIILAIVGAAVLAAFSLRLLATRRTALVLLGVLAALVVESIPYNGSPADPSAPPRLTVDPFARNADLYAWLSEQPADAVVFHFPKMNHGEYQYAIDLLRMPQSIINGWGIILPEGYFDEHWTIFPQPDLVAFLQARGVDYVVVHPEFLTELDYQRFIERLQPYEAQTGQTFRLVRQFTDGVSVYALPDTPVPAPLLSAASG